jgi:hypothetical protein
MMNDMDMAKKTVQKAAEKIIFESRVDGAMIAQVRRELGQSLSEFGLTLKRMVDPRATRGFTRQYISRLEHGLDIPTPEISGAIWNIATAMDDVPAGTGGAVMVMVLAQPGQLHEGTFIKRTMQEKRCKGCNVIFVGPGVFHDPECRVQYWKRTRRGGLHE